MIQNRRTKSLLALTGLMMAAASNYSDIYATRREVTNASIDDQGDAIEAKLLKAKPKRTLPVSPSRAGLQEFWYDDDFHCWAINQKTADKKHVKWLASLKKLE